MILLLLKNGEIQNIVIMKLYSLGSLDQKLFLVDYLIPYPFPVILFSIHPNDDGSLELLAILLRTNKGPRSQVMSKFSPPYKFLYAKMHVAVD